jgi:hypothetical protein
MRFLHRESLAMVLMPLVVMSGAALFIHFGIHLLDRSRLSEVLVLMGHARKEIVLEVAQRPAARSLEVGDPVVLQTLSTSAATQRLSLQYAREGDRIVARFHAPDDPAQQGACMLTPVLSPEVSDWVSNWRCSSRSTGRWSQIAQGACPAESSVSP